MSVWTGQVFNNAAEPRSQGQEGKAVGKTNLIKARRWACIAVATVISSGAAGADVQPHGAADAAGAPQGVEIKPLALPKVGAKHAGVPSSELKTVGSKPAPAGEAQSAEPASRVSGSTVQTLASLAGVLALIAILGVTVRLVSRRTGGLMAAVGAGGRAPSGLLEVLGRYPVGRGTTLVLLKMDRRVLLVSQGGGGKLGGATMTTLCEVTEPEDVASILLKVRDAEGDSMARRFETMLSGAEKAAAAAMEDPPAAVAMRAPARRLEAGPDSFDLARARHTKHVPTAVRPRAEVKRSPAAPGKTPMAARPRSAGGGS